MKFVQRSFWKTVQSTTFTIFYFGMLHLLAPLLANGQTSGSEFAVHGVVSNGAESLPGASVQLLELVAHSPLRGTMTGNNGGFSFTGLKLGRYVLKIAHLGYRDYSSDTLTLTATLQLPVIRLVENSGELRAVNIVAETPAIEQRLDRMVIDVGRNITANSSSALDILEKSPGITVDQNGNIMMRGKLGPIVMINGKQVQLSGTDLAEMLRAMAATNIQKIELINSPSARYDAAGNAGIIDIKLKKAKDLGANGNLSLNGGHGSELKSNNGGNFNYRGGNFSMTANYNYAFRGDFVALDVIRRFKDQGAEVASYFQDFYQGISFGAHTPRLGMEYAISKGITFGTDLFGTFTKIDRDIDNLTNLFNRASEGIGFRNMLSSTLNDRKNFGINLNIKKTIDTAGTVIGMDIDFAKFNLDDTQSYQFTYLDGSGKPSKDPLSLFNEAVGRLNIRSGAISLEHGVLGGSLEVGAKVSSIQSKTDMDFFNQLDGTYTSNESLSGEFTYTEQIRAGFFNYNGKLGKLSYQVGLRGERTIAGGQGTTGFSRKYAQLFPRGAVNYQLSKSHGLGFNFSRRVGRPTYSQLNPYFYFIEPTIRVAGSPDLLPALNYNLDLNYTLKNRYILTLNHFHSKNPIVESQTLDNANNLIIGYANLTSHDSYSITLSIPLKLFRWFSSTNNLGGFYGSYKGMMVSNGKAYLTVNTSNSLTFGNWSGQLIGNYNGRQYSGNMVVSSNWTLSLAAQRSFYNKRASLGLSFNDVFYTNNIRWANALETFSSQAYWRRDSRTALLNFTYKFGSNGQALKRKPGSADEEKGRAN